MISAALMPVISSAARLKILIMLTVHSVRPLLMLSKSFRWPGYSPGGCCRSLRYPAPPALLSGLKKASLKTASSLCRDWSCRPPPVHHGGFSRTPVAAPNCKSPRPGNRAAAGMADSPVFSIFCACRATIAATRVWIPFLFQRITTRCVFSILSPRPDRRPSLAGGFLIDLRLILIYPISLLCFKSGFKSTDSLQIPLFMPPMMAYSQVKYLEMSYFYTR